MFSSEKQPDRYCIRYSRQRALFLMCLLAFLAESPAMATGESLVQPAKTQMGDTLQVRLHDAILMGLEHNPTVTIQRVAPKIMETLVREQRAVFDPELTASAQKSETKSQRRLGTRPTPLELKDNSFDFTAQVSEMLPTGTLITVSSGMTGSISNLYTDYYTGNVEFTVTQSLLQGLGFGANLANLRRARLDAAISKSELRGIAEDVVARIEKGYWDLFLTGQEIEIQRKSLDLALQQLSESLERVKVGKLPELELAAVDAEVASRRGALIDVQSRHEQARLQLLYLLNPQTDNLWASYPVPADRPFLPTDTLDAIEVHEQLGMKYRPDLQQARFELEKGNLELRRTKNGLLPQLDLFVSLGRTSYASAFKSAYPDPNSPYYQATAGLSFTFPVLNRQAAAQLSRARFSREQQELAVRNMEKLVQLDIRSAYVEVLRSRQQIEATRVTRELQEKKLFAELEKFRVGKSTNYLVLQAQRDFTTSQLDQARAMVAYLSALIDLYIAEGALLERRGIESPAD